MTRGYEPDEFIDTRDVSEEREPKAQRPSRSAEPRDQEQKERAQGSGSLASPEETRSPEPRKIYEIRGRTYRLRTSEIAAMVEVGKFRVIGMEDLREFAYGGGKGRLRPDVENLLRQGLIQIKSVPHEERGPRQLLALTKTGHRLLKEAQIVRKDQTLYHGFTKPREAHHDADLYRLYQKAAGKIERAGGRNLRVVLDYEMKKRLYHDLAKLDPDRASTESKRAVAERHGLQVVRGKIPLPDVRIEYDSPDGERARVDLELATSHYRLRNLAEKVRAGFSIYAHANDVSNLRRVLDQRELTAEILSL
jgi:DNA-binding PadR family transcriptional regulator